jgi:type II secretory pathway component PulF
LALATGPFEKRARSSLNANLGQHSFIIEGIARISAVLIRSKVMQDLWNTVSKYPRFLLGTILGVLLYLTAPLVPLLKRPITAIALIGGFLAGLIFLTLTLRAMLGLGPV